MHLYLDVGNTALKWRLRGAAALQQGGGAHSRDWRGLALSLKSALEGMPRRIEIASVVGREADRELAGELQDVFGLQPAFHYSAAAQLGVTNAYAEPTRLGVDRWLAVVEAWHLSGASIVIDCGSALTLDAVDASGRHLGGYIVPGMRMLEASLLAGTPNVRIDRQVLPTLAPGRDTAACVHNGILRMSVAFITDAMVALQQGVQDTCSIFLTGGDALLLQPYLTESARVMPDLVLDGIERIVTESDTRG